MITKDGHFRLAGNGARLGAPRFGLLGKFLATVAGAAALIAGLVLFFLVFAIAVASALLVGGYLWWKTRALRRQRREGSPMGRVIDGEVIRDIQPHDTIQR